MQGTNPVRIPIKHIKLLHHAASFEFQHASNHDSGTKNSADQAMLKSLAAAFAQFIGLDGRINRHVGEPPSALMRHKRPRAASDHRCGEIASIQSLRYDRPSLAMVPH
ncbi:MAG: hypothetical protein CBB71_04945 [Rhodopirellula sp. TMED11]|nr:MAG: hypothetical protein CBB71_04945 [Rhodopirellula sp. TMED11]